MFIAVCSVGAQFNGVNEAVFFLSTLEVRAQNICFIHQNSASPGPPQPPPPPPRSHKSCYLQARKLIVYNDLTGIKKDLSPDP